MQLSCVFEKKQGYFLRCRSTKTSINLKISSKNCRIQSHIHYSSPRCNKILALPLGETVEQVLICSLMYFSRKNEKPRLRQHLAQLLCLNHSDSTVSQESFSEMEVLNMDFRIKVHFAQSVQICMFAEGKRSIYVVNLKNRSLFKIKRSAKKIVRSPSKSLYNQEMI